MLKANIEKLKKINRILSFLVVFISIFIGSGCKALAAEVAENQEEYSIGFSETEWGISDSLKGLFDSSTLYFQIGNWEVEGALLELHLMTSQLVNREISYLTILLDGQPIETIPIPEQGKEAVKHTVILPIEELEDEGSHSITVEAYLRGQTTDACVDDSAISTWMNILADSNIRIQYRDVDAVSNIAEFYKKFVSVEVLKAENAMLLTKEGTNDAVLTTMAKILSGFAQNTVGNYENIRIGLAQTEKEIYQVPYVIYVDRLDRLPEELSELLSDYQRSYAETNALVCLQEYEGTKVLLVTGNNDRALQKAGDLLSNPDMIPTIVDVSQQVSEQQDYQTESYQWKEYMALTPYGTLIKGNFEQSTSFGVECPTNRKLAESAQLSLDYRYSANLDFDKSLLTVYINGTPIGSRALTEEDTDGTTEVFNIPKDIEIAGSYIVETRFALYPKGEWCELTPEEIPWAYISDTSMLKWTTTSNTEIFFEYYPYPFIQDGEFSEVKMLFPKEWKESDLEVMAGILLTMGRWQKSNAGELEVISDPNDQNLADKNIISIGVQQKNYMDTKNLKVIGNQGSALLGISPYGNNRHAVLTITGQNNEGMKTTLKFLGQYARMWEIKGDLFYTDGENVKYTYIRQPEKEKEPPKVESPTITEENIPLIIVCSVLILILLAAAMLLIKYGRKNR